MVSRRAALSGNESLIATFASYYYRATACNATHGIAVGILSVRLSVRPSVCPSDAYIVTKLNNALWIFWYHTKRQSL